MCDTAVALGSATADGSVILGKNSDREPNEAQAVEWAPGGEHRPGEMARCTYIGVPQVRQTFGVLLCRPFWMWGCEMGVNAAGVAIGNEAVFTKEPHQPSGLLGMDMMRLALERAASAEEALTIITALLHTYGQGGVAGYRNRTMRYHNAFIIADTASAWVLETAGKYWAARRVTATASISNGLTIGADWDLASPGLVEHAIDQGWCRCAAEFDFARCYSDTLYTHASHCRARQARTGAALAGQAGIDATVMMATLRLHDDDGEGWTPARSSGASVCMHAGGKPLRDSQTVGSLVAHLKPGAVTAWVTATAAPCLSVFKPFYLATPLAAVGAAPLTGRYDPAARWWRHERLHRAALGAYGPRRVTFETERQALEATFVAGARECDQQGADDAARLAFAQTCWEQADARLEDWMARVAAAAAPGRLPWGYRRYWRQANRQAGMTAALLGVS